MKRKKNHPPMQNVVEDEIDELNDEEDEELGLEVQLLVENQFVSFLTQDENE